MLIYILNFIIAIQHSYCFAWLLIVAEFRSSVLVPASQSAWREGGGFSSRGARNETAKTG